MQPLVAVFLPLLAAYAVALQWCVERWNAPTEYFAHCWLLPFIAAAVVWTRRRDWRQRPREVDARGWLLLGPALALHLTGALLMIDSWSAASLVLAVPGAAWLALGRARLRGLWPVLWLTALMVPAPIYVEGRLAFELKEVAVGGGSFLANLLGADVVRQGDRLVPTGVEGSLFVADACSGLRSLLAMMTLAYCLAFFTGPARTLRRVALLLAAAPLAVLANVLRISALCLMARWVDVPFAEGTGHTLANAVEWVALLLTLLATDRWLSRRAAPPAGDAQPMAAPREPSPRSLRGPAVTLWLMAPLLVWLSVHRPFGSRDGRAERLPTEVAGFRLQPRDEAQQRSFEQALPRWQELLGTRDFVWRRYRDDGRRLISLVALYHDTNWKSVHPPRICIEGSNMQILRDDLVEAPWLQPDVRVSRIHAQSRTDPWSYVTLSVFGTRDWLSGDYWDFTLYHLPRALLRANESGFLLRVESPIYGGEEPADAEARCAAFLRSLLPSARSLLR